MTIGEYIKSLKERNIFIDLDNDQLKIKAAKESLSAQLIEEIKGRKTEIIVFLNKSRSNKQNDSIPGAVPAAYYQLSSAQKRLHFLYTFNTASLSYNMPVLLKLEGLLNREKLYTVFAELIARHESLRTSFMVIDDQVMQRIEKAIPLRIDIFEAGNKKTADIIRTFIRPFDLSEAPLLRVGLIGVSAREHILAVDMHHIIADGISRAVLMRDFMALYQGQTLTELSLQYKDYAEWQQSPEKQEQIRTQKAFWLQELSEEITPLELPVDYTRPAIKSEAGDYFNFSISESAVSQLKELAGSQGASLFMVMLAVYNVLLSKLGNQQDIVVGIAAAGRRHADLEGIIGMFVNTLPVRNRPAGTLSFKDFLAAVKQQSLAALEHQDYQYEDMIDALQVVRDTSRNPLFDVMLSYQNYEEPSLELPGLKVSSYASEYRVSKFDLTLDIWETDNELLLGFEYCTALFKRETIERFAGYLEQIIHTITQDINCKLSDISLLSEAEQAELMQASKGTEITYAPGKTIVDLLAEQVSQTPDKTAVLFAGGSMSYRQLQEQSDKIACYLHHEQGIKQGDFVGLLLERDRYLLPVLWAILKCGAAYVPLDPQYPAGRIQAIVEDGGLRAVVTSTSCLHLLTHAADLPLVDIDACRETIMQQPAESWLSMAQPTDIAYVIYTSGSTGKPKGVMVEHRSLVNYISWAADYYLQGEPAVFALYTSISFDLTVTSIYTPLVTGNSVLLYAEQEQALLVEQVFSDNIATVIKLTPSHLKVIRDSGLAGWQEAYKRKKLIVGGEQLVSSLARSIWEKFKGNIEIYNEYGPTEATVGCMIYQYDPADALSSVPIGQPIANTRIYILDASRRMVPRGIAGELYIGGAGLARGYAGNEALTADRFIADPFVPGARMYKTGDTARYLPDGRIEYIGRRDEQVKIRGFRIELGEIEHRLNRHEAITESAVIAREKGSDKYLVGYYVSGTMIDPLALRNFLQQELPDYMVPAFFVHLQQLPLTANGKLDRKSLPDPDPASLQQYVAPSNEVEEKLVELWAEVLKIDKEKISVTVNFFDVGGNSISIVKLNSRINTHFQCNIPVADMFMFPTIKGIRDFIVLKKQDMKGVEEHIDSAILQANEMFNIMAGHE